MIKRTAVTIQWKRFHAFVTFPLVLVYLILKKNLCIFSLYGLLICIPINPRDSNYWKSVISIGLTNPLIKKKLNYFLIIPRN
jgi:hypothetical protein